MSEYLKWHRYNDALKHWRNLLQGVVDDLKPIRTSYVKYLDANPYKTERKQLKTEITSLEIELHKKIKNMKSKEDIENVKSISKDIISKKSKFNKLHKEYMNYRSLNPYANKVMLLKQRKEEYVQKILATIDNGWDDPRELSIEQKLIRGKELEKGIGLNKIK